MPFQMRQRPIKPARLSRGKTVRLNAGESVQDFLDEIATHKDAPPLADLVIEWETTYEDEYDDVYAYWTVAETDEEYAPRLKRYELELKEWEEWHKNHKKEVKAYMQEKVNDYSDEQKAALDGRIRSNADNMANLLEQMEKLDTDKMKYDDLPHYKK